MDIRPMELHDSILVSIGILNIYIYIYDSLHTLSVELDDSWWIGRPSNGQTIHAIQKKFGLMGILTCHRMLLDQH